MKKLKVVVVNPPSKKEAKELIKKISKDLSTEEIWKK